MITLPFEFVCPNTGMVYRIVPASWPTTGFVVIAGARAIGLFPLCEQAERYLYFARDLNFRVPLEWQWTGDGLVGSAS